MTRPPRECVVADKTPQRSYPGWRAEKPVLWTRALRPLQLGQATKAVARELATYADQYGENARPGVLRLAWGAEVSPRTVIDALTKLEALGLVCCTERGSRNGRRGKASNYTLTVHDDLPQIETTFSVWQKAHQKPLSGARAAPDRGQIRCSTCT